MQKKRSTTTKKTLTAEERVQKLQKLMELKKKLKELEKEQDQSHAVKKSNSQNEAEKEVWIPPSDEKNLKSESIDQITPENVQTGTKVKQIPSDIQQPTTDQAQKTINQDEYLTEINEELENLEKVLASNVDLTKLEEIENADKIISQSFDTLSKPQKIKGKDEELERQISSNNTEQISAMNVDQELENLENEISLQHAKSVVVVSLFDQLCEEHEWLKQPQYGFMYAVPDKKKDAKDFESWVDEWSKVLFDYARIASEHIIYSKKLLSEKPWSDFKDRTSAIQEISDSLVKQKVADWLDKKKERLRVYWKSLEGWADYILDWAKRLAITEPILIQDIKNADEPFNTLPEEDIIKIFNILEKQGSGEKTKLKDGQYAIVFKI